MNEEENSRVLLAVCDALVTMVLDKMGTYIVRAKRGRFQIIEGHPRFTAHTIWQPSDEIVDRALKDAWASVPTVIARHCPPAIDADEVRDVLNYYVHDLAITGTPHSLDEMGCRLADKLTLRTERATWPAPYETAPLS